MGDVLRILTVLAAVFAGTLPAAAFDAPAKQAGAKKAGAQSEEKEAPPSAADEKSKTAVLVQQAFDAGIKAYGVGKNEEALRAFEAAIRGGLPSAQMPRMLYYRGLVFRKMGKPGFAVSDLTSALWLKNGLSEAERADATKMRALAFQEAGISDVPAVPQSSYAEAPALPGQSTPAAGTQTASAGGAPAPATSNVPAAPTPTSSSGGVSGFFSSLFGGGSSTEEKPPEPAPAATASIANEAPAADSAGWGGTTEVVAQPDATTPERRGPEIASPFVTQVASVEKPRASATDAAPVARSSPSGKYRLQVAAVRSRSEAEALAGLLVGRHAEQLGGRKPEVDESVIGSMGTFYRVRLGPYASAGEPETLCNALRSDGFDCLVVTQ
ncbi:MAG: SPOR domain-containing protein [Hyphomicrobium sp.]|nr:SPOR domain-containing protein [Hyphomicrobium sp.]